MESIADDSANVATTAQCHADWRGAPYYEAFLGQTQMLNANPIRELANNFLGLTVRQRDRVFASMILPSPGAPDSASTSVGVSQGAAKGGRETMCLQTLLKTDRREFYISPL